MANSRRKRQARAPATDAQNTGASTTGATTTAVKAHSFSRTVAQEHGEKAAVLLQYLAHHVSKSKHQHGGKKWFYKTLDDLAKVFPYLKRSTIHATLQNLAKENGPLLIGDYNKKGYDRTNWFAFRDDNFRKQAQSSKPAYFQVEDALKHGILAAVLLGNLVHWITENRKTDPQYTWHSMSPRELAKHLPFPKTTLQRAFADLVKAKVIKTKGPEDRGGAIQYAVVDETRLANPEKSGSKLDMGGGPNLEEGGPNLDMGGPNLDNNTTLIACERVLGSESGAPATKRQLIRLDSSSLRDVNQRSPPSGRPAMQLKVKTVLNAIQHFVGFVYDEIRFCRDRKGRPSRIEITVQPHAGIPAKCSRCLRPAPGYDQLPQRFWLFVPMWGLKAYFLYLPANTLVVIEPASNLPPDSPIKYWASPVAGHPWPADTEAWAEDVGVGLHEEDVALVRMPAYAV